MTELAGEAGVTRATIYNHATTPIQLAREALRLDLSRQRAQFEAAFESGRHRGAYAEGLRILVRHVVDHAAVYRREGRDGTGAPLLDFLASYATEATHDLLSRHPRELPPSVTTRMLPLLAASIAHAAVGAISAWLAEADHDEEDLVQVLFMTVPEWLRSESAVRPTDDDVPPE